MEQQNNGEHTLEKSARLIAESLQLIEKSAKYISGYLKFDLKKDLVASMEVISKNLSEINGNISSLEFRVEEIGKMMGEPRDR